MDWFIKWINPEVTINMKRSLFCLISEHTDLIIAIHLGDVDYASGLYDVVFPAEDVRTAFNISIIDDNVLETKEEFNLSISSIMSSRIFSGNIQQVTVFILDSNDGK